ncbi:MAG: GreA/GreB family elongation factor [Myxococcales bacterium]|nr:GreA/GreB family elongation factor [Myxococcales bacterium]
MSKAFTREDESLDEVVVERLPPPREPSGAAPEVAASGVVRAGAFVGLDDGSEVQVVEPEAANASLRRISVESPLGRALLGKRKGDVATVERPRGDAEYEIVSVRY